MIKYSRLVIKHVLVNVVVAVIKLVDGRPRGEDGRNDSRHSCRPTSGRC